MPKLKTLEEVIEEFRAKHGNKYDYSLVEYINNTTPVKIVCPEHGLFEQKPVVHKQGGECGKCAKISRVNKRKDTTESFIRKSREVHQYKYDYCKSVYIDRETKIHIICPKHGSFFMRPGNHINGKQGCKECGEESKIKKSRKFSGSDFIKEAKKIHGNLYDYSLVEYKNKRNPVKIICNIHGVFEQWPCYHLKGSGCKKCKMQNHAKGISGKNTFLDKVKKVHGDKYSYPYFEEEYINNKSKITIICDRGHEFKQISKDHLKGCGCSACNIGESSLEKTIENYLMTNNIPFNKRDRSLLDGLEVDFYLPHHNIAIECNGTYWHSEEMGKDKNYHLNKTLMAKVKGVRLIHIFEDEVKLKEKIVKSKLNSILKINKYKIHGRKCSIKEIPSDIKSKFLNKYHIQGDCKSDIRLGLFYKNRLVSVMTFITPRNSTNNHEYELNRLCSNASFYVVGGVSKMLKYFEKNYKPQKIVSYADKRWSEGNVYMKMGFSLYHTTPPKYWYVYNSSVIRESKYKFSLKKIKRKFEIGELKHYDENLTERENMKLNNYYRIWDCGYMVFVKEYLNS